MQIDVKDSTRVLDAQAIHDNLDELITDALSGLHFITGIDYTSAFDGKGKVGALKTPKGDERYQHVFSNIGNRFEFDALV